MEDAKDANAADAEERDDSWCKEPESTFRNTYL
jgi:hypothetical protein